MAWRERLSLVLTDKLAIKRVRYIDISEDEARAKARSASISTTGGNTTDQDEVFAHIESLVKQYDLQCLAFDRWDAKYIVRKAEAVGVQAMEFGQGYQSMSPAIKVFEPLVYNHLLCHEGNLALRWNSAPARDAQSTIGKQTAIAQARPKAAPIAPGRGSRVRA